MDKPIFLLDVDGVINCFPQYVRYNEDYSADKLLTFEAEGFTINVRLAVAEWLQELATSGRVEIRWLTTWGHDANHALVPHLGLPELKVQAEQTPRWGDRNWWKLDAVKELVLAEPDRRIIWADDDMGGYPGVYEFVSSVQNEDVKRLLAVAPQPDLGLSADNIDLIERFIGA